MEPQADLEPLPQSELSKMVVTRAKRTVPYPILGENTLVRGSHIAALCAVELGGVRRMIPHQDQHCWGIRAHRACRRH